MFGLWKKRSSNGGGGPPRGDSWTNIIADLEYLQRAHARNHPWLSHMTPGATDQEFKDSFFDHFYDVMSKAGLVKASYEDWRKELEATYQQKPFSRFEDPMAHMWLQSMRDRIAKACENRKLVPVKEPVFGLLQTGRINGMAADVNNDDYYLILIDDGIMGFANLLSKVVATFFPVVKGEDGQLHFSTDAEAMHKQMRDSPETGMRFFDLLIAYALKGAPHAAKPYLMETEHLRLVEVMRDSMEYFIFGHEYGHCTAGHLKDAEHKSMQMTSEQVSGQEEDIGMLVPKDWEKEFEADFVGLILALDAMQSHGISPSLSYAGIELVFAGIDYLQRTLSILEKGEEATHLLDSHPPAEMRRAMLRKSCDVMFDDQLKESAFKLADTINGGLDRLWQPAVPALTAMHQDGLRPHERWRQAQR